MSTHVIGDDMWAATLPESFGDVRDDLRALPEFGPDGYALSDIFPIRFEIIQEIRPRSVFEFGAYRGYFLVTALLACPWVRRVGWIDDETHRACSNEMCSLNVRSVRPGMVPWYSWRTRDCVRFGTAELVQVDASHSYPDCLTDLIWAMELLPRVIFVDDYQAHEPVRRATREFARWQRLEIEEHETVNGLAVLRF